MMSMMSGPLPPPQTLERYDKVVPGGAERIFGWVEKQSSHRQALERIRLEGDLANERRGQWFALTITLATLGASAYLVQQGNDVSGMALILTELALIVGIFVYGRESQKREREKARKELLGSSEEE